MKVIKLDDNTGRLLVVTSGGRGVRIDFPLDTIFNWYPLCNRYDYRYRNSTETLYLVLAHQSDYAPNRYGIKKAKGRAMSNVASFKKAKWCNPEVVKDNKAIYAFAKRLGIVTPDTDYTLADVVDGLKKVQDCLDTLLNIEKQRVEMKYQKAVMRYAETGNTGYRPFIAKYEEQQKHDREDQTSFILEHCTRKTLDVYLNLGDVYTMLSIMRKVVS